MKRLFLIVFAALGFMMAPIYAQDHHAKEDVIILPDRGLITASTPMPETAVDSRNDGVLRDDTGRPVTHDLLGQTLFQFEAPQIGGGMFNSDSLRGKWTVMTFWGVWCHDSRNDAENIAAVAAHFADHPDVQFMSLHVPYNRDFLDKRFGTYASVEAYFEDRGLSWPTALDEESILRNWQKIRWTPTYLLIGPDMTVQAYRTDLYSVGEGGLERFIAEVEGIARPAG